MKKGLDIKKLEELFGMEQELDIPMKDRFHNTLSAEQISELTATKGSYPADKIEQLKYLDMKHINRIIFSLILGIIIIETFCPNEWEFYVLIIAIGIVFNPFAKKWKV